MVVVIPRLGVGVTLLINHNPRKTKILLILGINKSGTFATLITR